MHSFPPLSPFVADSKCQAYIDIEGSPTVASWYEVWEGVAAIAMMCTRAKAKGGKAKGIGKLSHLLLPKNPHSPPFSQSLNKSQGLAKSIHVELSAVHPPPPAVVVQQLGHATPSTLSLAAAAAAIASSMPLRDFDPAEPSSSSSSSQAAFDGSVPFDLIPAGVENDDDDDYVDDNVY